MPQKPPDRLLMDQIADEYISAAKAAKTLQQLKTVERDFQTGPVLPQPQYARVQEVIEAVKQELRLGSG
jgi:hypothetical protein